VGGANTESNPPGAPVALHESPVAVDEHGVPRVLEHLRLDLHAGLVPDTLRVALDLHAVKARVAAERR